MDLTTSEFWAPQNSKNNLWKSRTNFLKKWFKNFQTLRIKLNKELHLYWRSFIRDKLLSYWWEIRLPKPTQSFFKFICFIILRNYSFKYTNFHPKDILLMAKLELNGYIMYNFIRFKFRVGSKNFYFRHFINYFWKKISASWKKYFLGYGQICETFRILTV